MGSSPGRSRESLLEQICADLERAQVAAAVEDLAQAGCLSAGLDPLLEALAAESGPPPTAGERSLQLRALDLHRALLSTLQAGKESTAGELARARGFIKALGRYRPAGPQPGGTVDVTD